MTDTRTLTGKKSSGWNDDQNGLEQSARQPRDSIQGPIRQIRRGARLLTLATAAVVIVLAATGCSIDPEPGPNPDTKPTPRGPVRTWHIHPGPGPNPDTKPTPPEPVRTRHNHPEPGPNHDTKPAPRELVGTWHNDPDGVDWNLTIAADGTYALSSTDVPVYDEGSIDTSDGRLHLITKTGDPRPSQLVVAPQGCDWKVNVWELYGISTTQLQLCNRAAWVMG